MKKKNIISLIKEIKKIKQILICIVDDNSPDNTYKEVNKKFKSQINKNIILIKRKKKWERFSSLGWI